MSTGARIRSLRHAYNRIRAWGLYLFPFLFFVLFSWISLREGGVDAAPFWYYGKAFVTILARTLGALLLAVAAYAIVIVGRLWFGAGTRIFSSHIQPLFALQIKKIPYRIAREANEVVRLVVPVLLSLVLVSLIMGILNSENIPRLQDLRAASWDYALFGFYPFFEWGAAAVPSLFIRAVIFSFSQVPGALAVLALIIFYANKRLFSFFAAAFLLNLVLMLPLWHALPLLSPHDRFIDNVYELPIPHELSEALARYSPQSDVAVFLEAARQQKNKTLRGVMPTSTLPSAHVAWAVFLCYFAWRVHKKLLLLALPFAAFGIFGTVALAQHYFADAPAGIAVAAVSLLLAHFFYPVRS